MTLRAVRLDPEGTLYRIASGALWGVVRARAARAA